MKKELGARQTRVSRSLHRAYTVVLQRRYFDIVRAVTLFYYLTPKDYNATCYTGNYR